MAYADVRRQGYRWLVVLPSGRCAGEHKTEQQAKAQAFAINAGRASRQRRRTARGGKW